MIGMYLFLKNNFKYQFNVNAGSERNELKLHSLFQPLNVLVFLRHWGNLKLLLFLLDLWKQYKYGLCLGDFNLQGIFQCLCSV